jgi:hypothetical protein
VEQAVDKEEKYEVRDIHPVLRRLALGYLAADKDLTTFLTNFIREDIWSIGFAAQLLV